MFFTSQDRIQAQTISSTVGGISATPTRSGPAGVYWNPAVIGTYSGTQLESNISLIGGWLIYDRSGINPNTGTGYDSISTSTFTPNPFFSISTDFGLEKWRFGYSTYFPSGAIARYPEKGSQRYDLIKGLLVPWNHQFTLAYVPSSEWSFALAGIYSLGFLEASLDIDLAPTISELVGTKESIPLENPSLSSRADIPFTYTHSFSMGFGMLYRPHLKWSFGLAFYLPTSYWFDQNLNLSMPSMVTALGAAPSSLGLSQEVSNQVRIHSELPAYINLGVRYQPYGYWTGEYFGRYLFGSKTQYTSIYFESSPIRKLKDAEIKGPVGKDSFVLGSVQSFSFWPNFHFGFAGSYSKNGVSGEHVTTSRIDFDTIILGVFFRYRFTNSLRLGVEYAHSFLMERNIEYSEPSSSEFDLFQKPSTQGRYRASIDRLGVHLSYEF